MAVNCAGIPGELLESEFFGHVAGAFTGATRSRPGLFQQAEGGTLLLDELGEMPVALQAKLLRVLEDGKVRAVGGAEERGVDVRVIAATNRDVDAQLRDGSLREDLFFRLETFTLELPALREREDDVELLARHFLEEFGASRQRVPDGFDPAALQALRRYPFPGNVRELRNAIERAVAFASGPRIALQDLPDRIARHGAGNEGAAASESLSVGDRPTVEQLQRRYAAWMLQQEGGNKLRTAERLGITRSTLYRWLEPVNERQGEKE